jgi:hypothetical protein
MRSTVPAVPPMTVWPADHQPEDSSEQIPFVNTRHRATPACPGPAKKSVPPTPPPRPAPPRWRWLWLAWAGPAQDRRAIGDESSLVRSMVIHVVTARLFRHQWAVDLVAGVAASDKSAKLRESAAGAIAWLGWH